MNNLFFSNNNLNKNIYLDQLNREYINPNEKKYNFKIMKNNACKSLYEVEYFLNNLHKFTTCIKLYKILK